MALVEMASDYSNGIAVTQSMTGDKNGLGGEAEGTPEWWGLPGGGWALVMITDADQSRCIIDFGDRSIIADPPLPAYQYLKQTRERNTEPEIVR